MKSGLGIAIGLVLTGGAIAAGFYFYNKDKAGEKPGSGAGSTGGGAGSGDGSVRGGSEPDTSGDDPRCADVFKLSRAQMLSELGLDPKTPISGALGGAIAPVNIGTPMRPKWVTPIKVGTLRLRIMSKRGIVKCGHEEESVSFSGGRGIFA